MKAFFFAPDSPRLTALIRIALGLVLLYDGGRHWRYAIELYSTAGPAMPIFARGAASGERANRAAEREPSRSPPETVTSYPVPVPAPAGAVLLHSALLAAAASAALGWHTRTSLVALFVLSAWLGPLDLPGTFGKHSVIALHLLLLLACSGCGAVWGIDALADANRAARVPLASVAPRRLMQILACCVYAGAAITKLRTPAFATGDLLTFSMLDDHWGSGRFGLWLTTFSWLPPLLSLATLAFELLFPLLVWHWRLPFLLGAFAFHAAMGLLLSVGVFSPIMFTLLLSFVEERDLAAPGRALRSATARLPWRRHRSGQVRAASEPQAETVAPAADARQAPAITSALRNRLGHLLAALAIVAGGFAIQFWYDWYGVFGRRSPAAADEVAPAAVAVMLSEQLPAYEDYFHRIELGSRFGGTQTFGSSREFRIGQRVFVLAQLIPPHPAIEWQGLLIAPDGREAGRFTHHVDAGVGYVVDGFELTRDLPAGEYRILLQAQGYPVAERRFELRR